MNGELLQQSWLECIRGCERRYSIFDDVYTCEQCGGLLDVRHDIQMLKKRNGMEWRTIFETRTRSNHPAYGSGVWGKKEWILPAVEDSNIVSMGEGNSTLLRAERLGKEIGIADLRIKQCGNSHTGSFKDLGMTVLVSAVKQMISDGKPIRAVACASTGDTSASLAAYAAAAGIPSIVILPRGKISTAQLAQPIAHGAIVLALDTDFDGCMNIVREVTADKSIYLANSMNALRMEGQKTVGIEITQQLDWYVPDWIVIPAGNLGNVSALGKGFLMMKELGLIEKLPRIACAQAANANPLYLSFKKAFKEYVPVNAQKTLASAIQIGAPVSYERAVKVLHAFDGVVEQATENELANAAGRADRTGLYCCPQTGVALAVAEKLRKQEVISQHEQVVVISTAHGLKFTDFKVGYHEQSLENVSPLFPNPPIELPAKKDAVLRAIEKAIGQKK
jgi:threonine synthase